MKKHTLNAKLGFSLIMIATAMAMSGCGHLVGEVSDSRPTSVYGVTNVAATADQCPYGGTVILTYIDLNANGRLDDLEPILAHIPVCNGASGISMGIDVRPATALACPNGGDKITVFKDLNNSGLLNSADPVTSITSICNGTNGSNGTNGTSASISVASASASQCRYGGYVFNSTGNSPTVVCNGATGQAGATGSQGIQGPAGQPGSSVTPVKFCNSDHSAFPEYGLLVGHDLFAVYWGTTPSSPSQSTAFLALITPGSYQSTGGNGCNFTINNSGQVR